MPISLQEITAAVAATETEIAELEAATAITATARQTLTTAQSTVATAQTELTSAVEAEGGEKADVIAGLNNIIGMCTAILATLQE